MRGRSTMGQKGIRSRTDKEVSNLVVYMYNVGDLGPVDSVQWSRDVPPSIL